MQFFKDMWQDELQPKVITYSALIGACGKGSVTERALQFFEEMRLGLQPNEITYSALLSACGMNSMPERTLLLFQIMRQVDVQPHVIIYSVLISACE